MVTGVSHRQQTTVEKEGPKQHSCKAGHVMGLSRPSLNPVTWERGWHHLPILHPLPSLVIKTKPNANALSPVWPE